jgi:hypothetical protein
MVAAAGRGEPAPAGHIPAMTVLTTTSAIERLERARSLADVLFRIQTELQGRGTVGLRVGAASEANLTGLAVRASALEELAHDRLPEPDRTVEVDLEGEAPAALSPQLAARAVALIGAATRCNGLPLPDLSNSSFLEYMHIEERRSTFPASKSLH